MNDATTKAVDPFAAFKPQEGSSATTEAAPKKRGRKPRAKKDDVAKLPAVLLVPVTVLQDLVDLDPEHVVLFSELAARINAQPKGARRPLVTALFKLFA